MSSDVTLYVKDIALLDNVREVGDVMELAASIKAQGILEPLVVRPNGGKHELVCGYRRLAAAKLLKLAEVPVVVREMTDAQVVEAQLVENLQRQDLNVLDEARAYRAYIDVTKATQAELGKKVGVSQSHFAKLLSVLELPDKVRNLIAAGKLSASHAEILATIPKEAVQVDYNGTELGQLVHEMAREVIQGGWDTRELESEVQKDVRRWRAHEDRKKRFAAMKPCPTCGSPAKLYIHDWENKVDVACEKGHAFNSQTGKLLVEERRTSSGGGTAPKKTPRNEPGTIRSMHTPYAIAMKLLKELGEKATGVSTSNELRVESDDDPPFRADIQEHDYSTGEKSSVHLDAYTDQERKEERLAFRKWEEKNLPARVAKDPPAADPKLLEGSIADAIKRLDKVDDDLQLQQLRALEVKGKGRVGLLNWFDLKGG